MSVKVLRWGLFLTGFSIVAFYIYIKISCHLCEHNPKFGTKLNMRMIVEALESYSRHHHGYPTLQQGLDALVRRPILSPIPESYPAEGYLPRIPKDGWKNDFLYLNPAQNGSYLLISFGADGRPGGENLDADILSDDLQKDGN